MSMADWSQLPTDILLLISECISGDLDILRFRSVCSSWRSSRPPLTVPLFFSDFPAGTEHAGAIAYSFSLQRRSVFLVSSRNCNQSWLLKSSTVSDGKARIHCPFSADKILCSLKNRVLDLMDLRVLELGHEYVGVTTIFMDHCLSPKLMKLVKRVAVTKVGAGRDSFALLAHHFCGDLALFLSGDKDWKILRNTHRVTDVASFNGKFYAVDQKGKTFMVDQYGNLTIFDHPGSEDTGDGSRFLVESGDQLLLVEMDGSGAEGDDKEEVRFRLHRLDVERNKWDEVRSLGGGVLFLGEVGSFSASDSQLGWPRGNFIYFATSSREVYGEFKLCGRDGGKKCIHVYDLEKGEVSLLENCSAEHNLFSPPLEWIAAA